MIVFLSIILAVSNIACSNKGQTSNMFSQLKNKNKNNDDIRYRDDNKTSKVFKLSVVLDSDKYFIDVTAYTSIENVITQVQKLSGQRIEGLSFKNNVLSSMFNLGDYEINKNGYKLTGKAGLKINKHSKQTQRNDSKINILENSNSISGKAGLKINKHSEQTKSHNKNKPSTHRGLRATNMTNMQSIDPINLKEALIIDKYNIHPASTKPNSINPNESYTGIILYAYGHIVAHILLKKRYIFDGFLEYKLFKNSIFLFLQNYIIL